MRRVRWSALALSCALMLFGSPARGESCAPYLDSVQPGELTLGYQLSATKTPTGYLKLALEAGPIATRAIRIYSEPSHSLLVVALDSAFRSTQEGATWESSVLEGSPNAAVLTVEPLAGGQATITIAPRPEGDKRIHVYVFGCWPDGTLEERLLADAGVGPGDFAFSSAVRKDAPPDDPTHCCQGGGCSQMCIDCSGPAFNCCLINPYCSIDCGPYQPCCGPPENC